MTMDKKLLKSLAKSSEKNPEAKNPLIARKPLKSLIETSARNVIL